MVNLPLNSAMATGILNALSDDEVQDLIGDLAQALSVAADVGVAVVA